MRKAPEYSDLEEMKEDMDALGEAARAGLLKKEPGTAKAKPAKAKGAGKRRGPASTAGGADGKGA